MLAEITHRKSQLFMTNALKFVESLYAPATASVHFLPIVQWKPYETMLNTVAFQSVREPLNSDGRTRILTHHFRSGYSCLPTLIALRTIKLMRNSRKKTKKYLENSLK